MPIAQGAFINVSTDWTEATVPLCAWTEATTPGLKRDATGRIYKDAMYGGITLPVPIWAERSVPAGGFVESTLNATGWTKSSVPAGGFAENSVPKTTWTRQTFPSATPWNEANG